MTQQNLDEFVNPMCQQILTTMGRVEWLYNKHQGAVNTDRILLDMWRKYFGSCENKEATIKRAGRHLRRKFPHMYKRDVVHKNESDEWQRVNQKIWR